MLPIVISIALLAPGAQAIEIREGLAVKGVVVGGRVPIPRDRVCEELAAAPDKYEPAASKLKWEAIKAGEDGWFNGINSGYLFCTFDSPSERPMILQASGHGMVYINGEPRGGDAYAYGYLKLPFQAKAGRNTLLFSGGRGRVKVSVSPATRDHELDTGDLTLPDVLPTDRANLLGAVVVRNNTPRPAVGMKISATAEGRTVSTRVPVIQPFAFRKVRFDFPILRKAGPVQLSLADSATTINVEVKRPDQHYKRTFVSQIDGSVQYYAVAPALKPSPLNALALTVHGASVEAIGQAAAYAPKNWITVVAATNRRPYGFDWEDWGRMDALEVLNIAEKEFPHDPARVFLTGHSMGGHGTWHVGTLFPDRFGAIAPSAGWLSFWSYGGGWDPREPNSVEKLLRASMLPSDTLARLHNLEDLGVYILHGDADDNVPVREARAGRDALKDWHKDLNYFEVPGAGHWWSNESVDFPGIFNLFRRRTRDVDPRHIRFTTPNPAISGRSRWVTIEQVIDPTKTASVDLTRTARDAHGTFQVTGTTDNVAALSFDSGAISASLDGQFTIVTDDYLRKSAGKWSRVPFLYPSAGELLTSLWKGKGPPRNIEGKNSLRGGPLKQAFQNRMVFVFGTRGTPEENAWSYQKARFDAETFYYRGNGDVEVLSDLEADPKKLGDRNIILYGNTQTNALWSTYLKDSPIQVDRSGVKVGAKSIPNAAVMFLRPYGEGKRLIGVMAGTDPVSSRTLDRLPVFVSGVAYPDWLVVTPSVYAEGTKGVT
ncbi:MAG TPA: prolyl oligopeptidase family serine peptidase, partial [Fimbriimonas sp.]|nr:prolyl oligopeptidase family serine peptidase [Fimbriimonas sp.]